MLSSNHFLQCVVFSALLLFATKGATYKLRHTNFQTFIPLYGKQIQWGSEYQTSLVFEWLKRGWMPNGLVFKCLLNT